MTTLVGKVNNWSGHLSISIFGTTPVGRVNDSSRSLAKKYDRVYMNGRVGLQPYVLSLSAIVVAHKTGKKV